MVETLIGDEGLPIKPKYVNHGMKEYTRGKYGKNPSKEDKEKVKDIESVYIQSPLEKSEAATHSAIKHYKKQLKRNPKNIDAQVNLEDAQKAQETLKGLRKTPGGIQRKILKPIRKAVRPN